MCAFAVVLASSGPPSHWLALQPRFLLGTLASALGLASALWMRLGTTLLLSAVAAGTGAVSLSLMTILATPSADPTLSMSGVWTGGALPPAVGWGRYAMGGLLLLAGVALHFTLGKRGRRVTLAGMTVASEAMLNLERRGSFRIATETLDGMALVRVVDNGSGVADDSTLFSPLVSSKRDGMGVGLFISRRIIENHGGKLWFEPVEGGGAEFRSILPLAMVDA